MVTTDSWGENKSNPNSKIGDIDFKILEIRNGELHESVNARIPNQVRIKKIRAKIDKLLDQRLVWMEKRDKDLDNKSK